MTKQISAIEKGVLRKRGVVFVLKPRFTCTARGLLPTAQHGEFEVGF